MEMRNGAYITTQDFEQWQDYFSPLLESGEKILKGCSGNCETCKSLCKNNQMKINVDGAIETYEETKNPDLKVKDITFVVTERCNLNCSYCLTAGTKVLTKDFSEKNIENITLGEELLGFEEYPNEGVQRKIIPTKVIQTHKHIDDVIKITFEDDTYINVTKNHPILNSTGEWINAGVYKEKNKVSCINKLKEFSSKKIKNIEYIGRQEVFNIATESHTYFANNIAVHNCYEVHKTGRRMTKEVAKQAVDFLFDEEKINGYYDFKKSPAVILEFIGGEPLLEIDLMNYIVEYFKFKAFSLGHPWATNYMINFTSNGILFKSKKVQNFIKRNAGKVSIGLTIDGNKKLHDSCRVFPDGSGSYDIVEESIKEWVKIDEKPQTKITLSPSNVMYLNEALKNVWSLGVIGAYTNCVFEEGWTIEHAKILYEEMIKLADYLLSNKNYTKYFCSLFDETIGTKNEEDRNWCGGNGEMLAIAPDGKCFPCIRFMKYSLSTEGRKEQPIGDIYNGLDKKEDNEWLNKLKQITMSSQSSQKCLNCPISRGCSLCTGYNYDKFGDPNHRATFICDMHHARVMANVYYWNSLYKKLEINKIFKMNVPKEWALKIINKNKYEKLIKMQK